MKKPTVCFVCHYGLGTSGLFKFLFEDYLNNHNLQKTVDVVKAGVARDVSDSPIYNLEHAKILKNFDYLVLTSNSLLEKLNRYNPKGKVMTMEELYKKAGWTKEKEVDLKNSRIIDDAFTVLVNEIYENELAKKQEI
ncbi:MAG: hypothetical protein L6408_02705 [Nanoarchaeota archaeon]|nr:hypothetical protein [Nanoarchaeota archaeon]